MAESPIVLLSDFGSTDPYVGIMKGVINRIAPEHQLIDLSHQIPPGDVQEGAFHLWQAAEYFSPETVFLAVVDPGVGTERRGLFFSHRNQTFIGPDNGLFTYLSYQTQTSAWELQNPDLQLQDPSNTFHGRDIFAPAAAYAALGYTGDQFGGEIQNLIQLPKPICQLDGQYLRGEVVHIDRFGNLITSLGYLKPREGSLEFSSWIDNANQIFPLEAQIRIEDKNISLPLVRTFADIPQGKYAGLIGSSGLLEIAANQNSAADLLGFSKGDSITLQWN